MILIVHDLSFLALGWFCSFPYPILHLRVKLALIAQRATINAISRLKVLSVNSFQNLQTMLIMSWTSIVEMRTRY